MLKTSLCQQLGIDYPRFSVEMGGGMAGPELVAAVSNAGACGVLGMGGLPAPYIRQQIHHLRTLTNKPFGVNLLLALLQEGQIETSNARHEHEWKVWQDVQRPYGKLFIPGLVAHATNVVEPPELVADRLVQSANLVGRENVIAGTDCRLVAGSSRDCLDQAPSDGRGCTAGEPAALELGGVRDRL